MMTSRKTICGLAGLLIVLGSAAAPVASAASVDQRLNKAIKRMLMNMDDGPVSQMSKREKEDLAVCVNGVFGTLPEAKKRFIVEAANEAELRSRFDQVGLENRARLKQQVRDDCA